MTNKTTSFYWGNVTMVRPIEVSSVKPPRFERLISEADSTGVKRLSNDTLHHSFVEHLHTLHFVIMITTLILNTLVFILIVLNKKILKKYSSKFFLNLQVVHIGLSLNGIISSFVKWGMKLYIKNALLMMMFFCLLMMTLERYLAIKIPYKYGKITSKEVNDFIFCSWIPTIIFVGLAKLFEHPIERDLLMSIGIISVAAAILGISNISIYITVKKHFIAIKKHKSKNSLANLNVSKEKKRLKSAYVVFAIVASFFILYSPFFIYNVLRYRSEGQNKHFDERFTESVQPIAELNSMIDPILFVCFRQDVKKEMKRFLGITRYCCGKHTFAHTECIPMTSS